MSKKVVVVGAGLAGLSAGCYARMCGFDVHVLEHAPEPGGMCTSWSRAPYTVDGCIHWLAGAGAAGAFRSVYQELGILRDVVCRPLTQFERFEDPQAGWAVELGPDLGALRSWLEANGPEDHGAIAQLYRAIERCAELPLALAPHELTSFADGMRQLWEARKLAPALVEMRASICAWSEAAFRSAALRSLFRAVLHPEMPAWLLPVLLHMVGNGQLARPVGGSGMLRDAVVRRFRELGGLLSLNTTVDEIVVNDGAAQGVRLQDGTLLEAGAVICTASAHETQLRLLAGRPLDGSQRKRLDEWRTFDPIVMVSIGVATPLADQPSTVIVRQAEPLIVGGRANEWLLMRVFNDAPWAAPAGHTVVQTLLATRYDDWASAGAHYQDAKRELAEQVIERFSARMPQIRDAVRMVDVATPLTFWRWGRAWRGAYEGWLPTPHNVFTRISKRVHGVDGLYLAGQWVEPGGGVPPALLSGRQAVQLLAHDFGVPFVAQPAC